MERQQKENARIEEAARISLIYERFSEILGLLMFQGARISLVSTQTVMIIPF